MVIKGVRFGETCGMACGPVSGPTFAEVMVYDKEGKSSFVLASIFENDLQIVLSDYPLYDIMYNAFLGSAADFEAECDKADKLSKCIDDYDIDDEEEDGYGQFYPGMEKAVDFAVSLLRKNWEEDVTEEACKAYIGKDLVDMDIPYIPFCQDDEDEEDEE